MEQSTKEKSNVLPRIENTFFISLRQDLLLLCQGCTYRKNENSKSSPYCKALILSILEGWTNSKMDKRENLFIPMTMPQWIDAFYGLYKYNAIADSLEELAHEGLISREKFKTKRAGKDQYKYLLNFQQINARLQTLTFPGLSAEQTVTNHDLSLTNQGLNVTSQGLSSSQTIKSQGCIDSKITLIESNKESSTTHNVSSFSKKVEETNNVLPEKEQQLIKWYCEVSGMKSVNMTTKAAQECMIAILPEINTIEDARGLYEQTVMDVEARKDATNKIAYFSNQKDSLLKWKQNKASQQQQRALEQEDPNKLVLGTRYRIYEDFTATADRWFLFEMMPLQEAEQQLRMFNRDRVNGYQENRIREKLDASDEVTKRGLIDQWLNGKMAVAV